MDQTLYAQQHPFSILVWNDGVWNHTSHHQTRSSALASASTLAAYIGVTALRVWDNTSRMPLSGWDGSPHHTPETQHD